MMTGSECLRAIALEAFKSGCITEECIKKMTRPDLNKTSYRNHWRVMRFLRGVSLDASGKNDSIVWGENA